jgi:hypothetical protein
MSERTTPLISDAPRFCPGCGRPARDGWASGLCPDCGGTLVVQGYCPICEARLRRQVGEPCPKHDVELMPEEPVATPFHAAGLVVSWVTVKRFPDSLAASASRIRLDAEGIPTFLEGERMGAPAMYRVATGGVKLQVPADLLADARVILDQDWSWPGEELDHEDAPAPDEESVDSTGESTPRAFLIELIVVLALAIPLIVALVLCPRGD